jgi:hypothetical protein
LARRFGAAATGEDEDDYPAGVKHRLIEIGIRCDASTLIDVAHRFSLVSARLISPTWVGMLAGHL